MAEIQPKVIGVTGSYGKTTTKAFITDVLNGRYRVYATPKSYNTVMGVCLAINTDLADDYSVDYFVVEMGAYVEGEIKRIADVTPPVISVVVEVGPQHLERFGTLENTAKAKYEIIEALPVDGLGVFNWDNPYVRAMYERGYPDKRIAVSKAIAPDDVPDGGPRFVASEIEETLDGLTFTVTDVERGESEPFTTSIVGEHNVTNILLATAVAVHEGMSLKDVAFRARTLQPPESRLVRRTTPEGITIINDAYSANPAGVVSALKVLGLHTSGKRTLITPGMVELGDLQDAENRKLGELAAEYSTDIILVGAAQTAQVKAGLLGAGFPTDRLTTVEELREAMAWQAANLKAGDAVMFLNDLPDTY
jgi:UDP-N-acetylmuramoyl-tripeptide--D-alanyl-D-alanine ligase